jgi:uncharacterized protein (TIGR03437 family)
LACNAIVPATATINAQVPFTATTTLANCTGAPTYEWNFGDGTPNSTLPNPKHTYAQARSYNWSLTVKGPSGTMCNKMGTIAVRTSCLAPVITTQPQSRVITSGGTVKLEVTANGTAPFTYQWYEGNKGDTSKPVAGATAASFTTPPLTSSKSYWVRVSSACGSVNSNTGAAMIGSPSSLMVEAIDPACDASMNCEGAYLKDTDGTVWVEQDVNRLLTASWKRRAIVTDGVTLLLLRVRAESPVTFSLAGSPQTGVLFSLNGVTRGSSITAAPGANKVAFAVYKAPLDSPANVNEIKITATATSATGSGSLTLELRQPPVVLIHGVWSSKGTWMRGENSLPRYLQERGFVVALADYSDDNAGSFRPNSKSIPLMNSVAAINEALSQMRSRGAAVTQVDVIAHSMGGLVARSIVATEKNKANYNSGYLHKLITIGTPHQGTPLADWLIANRNAKLQKAGDISGILATVFGRTTVAGTIFTGITLAADSVPLETYFKLLNQPLGPALAGFQTTSCERFVLGKTSLPSHAFFCQAPLSPNESNTEKILDLLLYLTGTSQRITTILGNGHDTIVPVASQQGGLPVNNRTGFSNIVHAPLFLTGDNGETTEELVWQKVAERLRNQTDDKGIFADSFERPASTSTCPTNALELPTVIAEKAPAPPLLIPETTSAAKINFSVTPNTVVRPGDLVTINFSIENGNPVEGAIIRVGEALQIIGGSSQFTISVQAPIDKGGRLEIIAATFGGSPENYVAGTYLNIEPAASLVSITALTPNILLRNIGETSTLEITGTYSDSTQLSLNGTKANTTYAVQGGATNVVTVSPEGVITARGNGQATVVVTNAGKTATVKVYVSSTGVPNNAIVSVSAANYTNVVFAPEEIVAVFGTNLATASQAATVTPLPTVLGGASVRVTDSTGTERLAPLFFVSPTQINYQIPPGTAPGAALVRIDRPNDFPSLETLLIDATAPGLFTANANGSGVPAALALRVKSNGAQSYEPIAHRDTTTNRMVATPIDLGPAGEQVFLILYGTGIRFRSSLAAVTATAGGVSVPVSFAQAQGSLTGLDQINLGPLPSSLRARGNVDIVLRVDGKVANTVQVSIK